MKDTVMNVYTTNLVPKLVVVPYKQALLDILMTSIQENGIQEPIEVVASSNRYYIVDGMRRWYCASMLGIETVPIVVVDRLENL